LGKLEKRVVVSFLFYFSVGFFLEGYRHPQALGNGVWQEKKKKNSSPGKAGELALEKGMGR